MVRGLLKKTLFDGSAPADDVEEPIQYDKNTGFKPINPEVLKKLEVICIDSFLVIFLQRVEAWFFVCIYVFV